MLWFAVHLPWLSLEAFAATLTAEQRQRPLALLAEHQLAHLVEAASLCDGVVKGLKHPLWPLDPWDALRHLVLLLVQAVASPPAPRGKAPLLRAGPRLALEA